MEFIVKKLGGENAGELYKSALNINDDFKKGKKQAIVVSAQRSDFFNTTDNLIFIGEELIKKIKSEINIGLIENRINEIEKFHLDILEEKLFFLLDKNNNNNFSEIKNFVINIFKDFKEDIFYYIENNNFFTSKENDYLIEGKKNKFSIIGFGEVISSKILSFVIGKIDGLKSEIIDLSNLISDKKFFKLDRKEQFDYLSEKISNLVEESIINDKIPVLSGYIGVFEKGIENTIGRGYTDATAAILATGLARKGKKVILEIQKSVKGVLSSDPRILENPNEAKLIEELDYITAREITGDSGAKAKLLHNQALRSELQESCVKIHLFNPFIEKQGGTWIKPTCCKISSGIDFIGAKKNIFFFSVSSGKMFEKGILSRLFTIVKDFFSVDIISTSETEISFTIDGDGSTKIKIDQMIEEIKEEFNFGENTISDFITYTTGKSLIYCVGKNLKNLKYIHKISNVFIENGIELDLLSLGQQNRAIILGIDGDFTKKAVNLLHKEFIVGKNTI